ncbi:COMM domain-containing protein 3-like [Ischnura elegans]|uniref:COMM domain-containing protein 3-like n=1 Tax=Ischnura elegans TaxID=197161 RepID=UPI001ED8777F|nr:COMM domain-containing protein 3-like [Ischnura elegans]XP_046387463.1 COMM domain-containing protein 3-like [Ischnura elegans]XP_046387464.1 COMM domain-containing protein 3-like [Ischnura elegans]
MEISNQISEGLKLLAVTSKIDDDTFRRLLEASLAALSNPDKLSEARVSQFADIDGKAAYAALLTVILEAARHDTDPTSLSSLLEEKKLESSRIEKILKLFGIVKPKLQAHLSGIGSFPPHVVDATWRLDYVTKSGNLEYKSGPQYLINLVTEVPGVGEKKIQFACTMEEMQDLVGKLREASKLIERVANV